MPTLIGSNTLTSISRHIVRPVITDQFYGSNSLFFRLNKQGKKKYTGGLHYESPMLVSGFTTGGAYEGYDLLDVAPQETIKNAGWDMKQYYQTVALSGRDLARANTEAAVADLVVTLTSQAVMDLADKIGTDVHGTATTDAKRIDGLRDIVDNASVATSYGGLVRSSNTYLNAQIDSSTATLTLSALNSLFQNCTKGGHSPTLILSRVEQYNRGWNLLAQYQRFTQGPSGADEVMAHAGFTNFTFNGVPWLIDGKTMDGPNTSNSAIVMLDETTMELACYFATDFEMEEWLKPTNQDAMVQKIKWFGNLMDFRPQTNGKMTNVSA